MSKNQGKWPASLPPWPADDTGRAAWLANAQNKNFDYWKEKRPGDTQDWAELEFAVREVTGKDRTGWTTDHTRAVGDALLQENLPQGKHLTVQAKQAIVDRVLPLLLPSWKYQSHPGAAGWLEEALRALAPRLFTLYRQKQGRRLKKADGAKEVDGGGENHASAAAKPPPPASTPAARSAPKPPCTPSTAGLAVRTNENKRPRILRAEHAVRREAGEEQGKHKLDGIDRSTHLRALDRSIVVRIEGQEFPVVVGMHALLQEQHLERGLDNLTHIHLCWRTFSRLLGGAEPRYAPEYSEESLEVRWMDPSSREVRLVDNQAGFVRAVGILGNAAGDAAYIEMILS